jgi:hypothetical protein
MTNDQKEKHMRTALLLLSALWPAIAPAQTTYNVEIRGNLAITVTPAAPPAPAPPPAPTPTPTPPPAPDIKPLPQLVEIGPGKAYASPADVDWRGLQPGTDIRLYYRQEPYCAKLMLSRDNCRLTGVAGPNGERPILSGKDAKSPPMPLLYNGHQPRFVILVSGRQKPKNVTVENLIVEDAYDGDPYVDIHGQPGAYTNGTGVWVERGDDVTLSGCLFRRLVQGYFASSDTDEASTSRRLTVKDCEVTACGDKSGVNDEQTYTEADVTILENVHIHDARNPGTTAIHSRDGKLVLKNCHIESGGVCLLGNDVTEKDSLLPKDASFGAVEISGTTFVSTSDSETLSLRADAAVELAKHKLSAKNCVFVKVKSYPPRYYSPYFACAYVPAEVSFDACSFFALSPNANPPAQVHLTYGNEAKLTMANLKAYIQDNGFISRSKIDGAETVTPADWTEAITITRLPQADLLKKAREFVPGLAF